MRELTRFRNATVHRLFLALDSAGLHVAPKHYYSPVPDVRWLRSNRRLWVRPSELPGIEWDLEAQLDWLADVCRPHYNEVRGLRVYDEFVRAGDGLGYGPIESQVLHCFIRRLAPGRVIETGAGVSTVCMLHAGELNRTEGRTVPRITCIGPEVAGERPPADGVTPVNTPLQAVPGETFDALAAGDLLFIDSSHAVKTGSDVVRLYLEIIPRLRSGVVVHIHDVNLPYSYPRDALTKFFGWQETALLQALLVGNPRLRVRCCLSALHYDRSEELARILPDYVPQENDHGLQRAPNPDGHFPSSIWLETTEA